MAAAVTTKDKGEVTLQVFETNSDDDPEYKPDEFHDSYFDMPMVDYTYLENGGISYSITLSDIPEDPEKAPELFIAVLPSASYRGSQAYQFDEMLDQLVTDEIRY